ncbi:MAG TPA: DUF169 domain-containing protein [Arenibaculum sp.]|nr:DUF169 domain-containing protein [Arenibaculum sp.]
MPFDTAASRLTEALELDLPPVALAFLDEPPAEIPAGINVAATPVPSACTFWRRAEHELVYASADAHRHCPIGAFVMGFELPPDLEQELGGLIAGIIGNGYISADEPARLPRPVFARKGILYGPLATFPVEPDAVLIWMSPAQAMIWSEASGGAAWGSPVPATAFGRPACAAVPAGMNAGRPVLSLGCAGMRTFTGIAPDRMLAVAPGRLIGELADAVAASATLNDEMRHYYEGRRAAVADLPGPGRDRA